MSEVVQFKRKWAQRHKLSLPESFTRFITALGETIQRPGPISHFKIKRCKEGCMVILTDKPRYPDGFAMNYSSMSGIYPVNFDAARKWMRSLSCGIGYELIEIKAERMPISKGNDRKILKSGGCLESWLDSDIPELWAEAMTRCEHASGYCGQDGYCHYGTCNMTMDVPECECRIEVVRT